MAGYYEWLVEKNVFLWYGWTDALNLNSMMEKGD